MHKHKKVPGEIFLGLSYATYRTDMVRFLLYVGSHKCGTDMVLNMERYQLRQHAPANRAPGAAVRPDRSISARP